MSQTKRRLKIVEPVPFQEGSFTERGEKVYTHLEINWHIPGHPAKTRVLKADEGLGFTEEWIEDTIYGCAKALEVDYPEDRYRVERHAPNRISFVYDGPAGMVQ